SCGPEQTQDKTPDNHMKGGCVEDWGIKGSDTDILGREVTQVGIVKGVDIEWDGLNDSKHGRCELVVLTPNNWFENLIVRDARVEVYNVDPRRLLKTSDQDLGWLNTLVMQAIGEQSPDY